MKMNKYYTYKGLKKYFCLQNSNKLYLNKPYTPFD